MLDKEHEDILRELYGDMASEERLQNLIRELTNDEFWQRMENLQRGIMSAKRDHYYSQQRRGQLPRRPS